MVLSNTSMLLPQLMQSLWEKPPNSPIRATIYSLGDKGLEKWLTSVVPIIPCQMLGLLLYTSKMCKQVKILLKQLHVKLNIYIYFFSSRV